MYRVLSTKYIKELGWGGADNRQAGKLTPKQNTKHTVLSIACGCKIRSGVCGEGPWCIACVMARLGEAALERTCGGGELTPKTEYGAWWAHYWHWVQTPHAACDGIQ